jgi:hypothetical protein
VRYWRVCVSTGRSWHGGFYGRAAAQPSSAGSRSALTLSTFAVS